MTSCCWLAGRRSGCRCSRTKFVQSLVNRSGIGHPREAVESVEEDIPFPAQRCEFFLAGWSEAVVAAVAAGLIGLPAAGDPAAFFEVVEHGIERGEGETQRAAGLLLDLFGDFKAVEGLIGEQGKDGQFGAAPGDFGTDALGHDEYRNPIFRGFRQRYFSRGSCGM